MKESCAFLLPPPTLAVELIITLEIEQPPTSKITKKSLDDLDINNIL